MSKLIHNRCACKLIIKTLRLQSCKQICFYVLIPYSLLFSSEIILKQLFASDSVSTRVCIKQLDYELEISIAQPEWTIALRNRERIVRMISIYLVNETGYGPSSRYGRLLFDGDERKYEQWEVKFLGYMRLRKLKDSITAADDVEITAAKNEETFAELIQFLDDKSLALVMRDARDDGRKALKILRAHYAGTGKPRIISLYTELTSLVKSEHETVTD